MLEYRSEIDGLRAVAVVPVILFHAGIGMFAGGFVGVDVFFVISGYLITSIIAIELEGGRFSLLRFYERRARRILPALFVVMLASLPVAWLLLLPADMENFAQSLIAVALFSSNVLFFMESGYFDTAAEVKPLLHTWSLALEEQFYIFFPLVLMACWRFGRRLTLAVLGAVFVVSFGVAEWGAQNVPSAAFYLLPTRAWELLIGSFAALLLLRREVTVSSRVMNGLSLLGLLGILVPVFIFDSETPFPGVYAVVPTVGTLLVILFARRGTVAHKVLSVKPMIFVGLLSYSLYLWHQPLLAFARHQRLELDAATIAGALGATCVLSYGTYRLVETPMRRRSFLSRRTVLGGSVVALAACALLGVFLSVNDVYNRARYESLLVGGYEPELEFLREESWQTLRELTDDESYGVQDNPADLRLWFNNADPRPKMLLVGNSHSKDLFNVFSQSDDIRERVQLARFGTQIEDIGPGFFDSENYRASTVIVIASRYSDADLEALPELVRRLSADRKIVAVAESIFEFSSTDRHNLADHIILPCIRDDACDTEALPNQVNDAYFADFVERTERDSYYQHRAFFADLASDAPGLILLDRMDPTCDLGARTCYGVGADLTKYFYDYGHFTLEGAAFFANEADREGWLEPILSRVNESTSS